MLRPYQKSAIDTVYGEWQTGTKSVLLVSPTGTGKTTMFCHIINDHREQGVLVVCHRQELLSQISNTLAKFQVYHQIISAKPMESKYIDKHSKVYVVSIDSFVRREFNAHIELVVFDEAHHVLPDNKWGKGLAKVKGVPKILGVTATPQRNDGRSLKGVFTKMVESISVPEAFAQGYLCPFKAYTPNIFVAGSLKVGSSGDFTASSIAVALEKNPIVGSVVDSYLKYNNGSRGVTFAPNVKEAQLICDGFTAKGVPSAVISAKTPDKERRHTIDLFESKKLLQLINVDIFGEGFDLPCIETVSLARPTNSLTVYLQQVGRLLRPYKNKDYGVLLDHVGNIKRHGLPNSHRRWELTDKKKSQNTGITNPEARVVTCFNEKCMAVYQAYKSRCPFCGHAPDKDAIQGRKIDKLDGDLVEVTSIEFETAAKKQVDQVFVDDGDLRTRYSHLTSIPRNACVKHARLRKEAAEELKGLMKSWSTIHKEKFPDSVERKRLFYLTYGLDIYSALCKPAREMKVLSGQILEEIEQWRLKQK